jgi:hypothetical protein
VKIPRQFDELCQIEILTDAAIGKRHAIDRAHEQSEFFRQRAKPDVRRRVLTRKTANLTRGFGGDARDGQPLAAG